MNHKINQLQVFNFNEAVVRTILQNGDPWFVAADICAVLEIHNVTMALERLGSDERTLISVEGARNGLPVNAVNESGLYTLIMTSRKPEAKRFRKWVTSEVLPTIRKTGQYGPLKRCTEVEAAEIFPVFHRVAKLVGLDKNRAAIAANAATKRLTDIDLLELLDVADSVGGEITPDNNTLLRGLIQLMEIEAGPVRGTFKDVLERVAALVKPDRRDYTFPNPHKFRRSLERIKSQLADAGISFEFGKHTARGYVVEIQKD